MLKGKCFLASLAALAVVILVGSSTVWPQTILGPSPQEQYLLQQGLLRQRQEQQIRAQEQQRKAREKQRLKQQQPQHHQKKAPNGA